MPKPRGKVEFDKSGLDWFWNIYAANGCILCDGAQGYCYSSEAKARQGFAAAIKIAVAHQAAERKRKPRNVD
jgi:hypothetical protein